MYILFCILYLIAMFIWGDWRNWKKYYSTILFFIIGDLLYNFLLFNQPWWLFHDLILPNHSMVSIVCMFVAYPATVLIYLGRFPVEWKKRSLWFLLWSAIYLTKEYINENLGFITYHNGWNFGWSVLFTGIIFLSLPVHFKKPLLAWALSVVIIIFFVIIFDLKLSEMK
jgi:hypothetical protein